MGLSAGDQARLLGGVTVEQNLEDEKQLGSQGPGRDSGARICTR